MVISVAVVEQTAIWAQEVEVLDLLYGYEMKMSFGFDAKR